MAKPLGYYGLNLDISTELAIDGLSKDDLTALNSDCSFFLNGFWSSSLVAEEIGFDEELADFSALQLISLIRALLDRIEVKLMEVASND